MTIRGWLGAGTLVAAVVAGTTFGVSGSAGDATAAPATPSTKSADASKGPREVAVTVYNDNLGVVKDRRTFSIASGRESGTTS